jgi:dipeptidyl aminopeptidase/acylaminoacyl peptidase
MHDDAGSRVDHSSIVDLRPTGLYKQVEEFFTAIHAPGEGRVTDAADLAVAPNGATAAFTGTVFLDITQAPVTRICFLTLGTAELQLCSSAAGNDRHARYSPNGEIVAFLSDRAESGAYQLYLADAAGKSPAAAPTLDGVVESLSWSPGGAQLLLGVAGFGADIAGAQGGATTVKKVGGLPTWVPTVDTGDAENLWRAAYLFELATQRYRRISPHGLNIWECAWLNARELIAIVSHSHGEGSWYESHLVVIEIDGAVRDLYRPIYQLGGPVASPDSRHVAVIEALCSDRLIVCGEVRLIELATGHVRRLDTAGVDVTQLTWCDNATLVFVGHRGLQTVLGEIDLATGAPKESWSSLQYTFGAWYPSIALLPQSGVLAVSESYAVPPEIVKIQGGRHQCVLSLATPRSTAADFNDADAEPVAWTASDGLELQGWLIRPRGPGPFPLVMDIHGGPVWACRNRWQGRLRGAKILADHGIASLYPNPRGSSGRGTAFAARVRGDMGGADTYDYLSAVDALVERGIADPERLGVTGISYGGYISAWLVTQDARFVAAAPISPVTNWYSQHRTSQIPYFDALFLDGKPSAPDGQYFARSPVMFADRVKTPVLQLTGALDQNTPPTQAIEFHRSLLAQGVRSVLATYPNAGHGIRGFPEVIDATTRYVGWFLEYFGPRETASTE